MKNFISITIKGAFIELSFHFNSSSHRFGKIRFLHKLREFVYGCKVKIKRYLIFDSSLYSEDFHVILNGSLIQNQDLDKILNVNFGIVENLAIIVPNKYNITSGKHKIALSSVFPKFNFVFKMIISTSTEEIEFPSELHIEKILQKSESSASYQQDARESQNKLVKRAFQIVLLVYIPILLIFFGITLSIMLDPAARQTDAGLGPGLVLIFLIGIGLIFLPNFKRGILGKKKE